MISEDNVRNPTSIVFFFKDYCATSSAWPEVKLRIRRTLLHCLNIYIFLKKIWGYFFGVLERFGHSIAHVAHFVSLRDVWIWTQRAAVGSRNATNLATHLPFIFNRSFDLSSSLCLLHNVRGEAVCVVKHRREWDFKEGVDLRSGSGQRTWGWIFSPSRKAPRTWQMQMEAYSIPNHAPTIRKYQSEARGFL